MFGWKTFAPQAPILMKYLILCLALAWGCSSLAGEPAFQVPQGFTLRRAAEPSAVSFPMFATLDTEGRLYVTESSGNDLYAELTDQVRKCRVILLQDRNGDGLFETTTVFAQNLTPSMGLVWREGK